MFARWGRFVYRFRWATLIASALLLGVSIVAIFTGGTLADNGGFGANLPAGKAAKLIKDEIHPQGATATNGSTTVRHASTAPAVSRLSRTSMRSRSNAAVSE